VITKLRRVLGLTELTFYGIGSLIGAGIYSIIGVAAGEAGNFLWLSFITAGGAAFLTALSYSELASTLTKAGAEYQYIKFTFPTWHLLAFLGGYLVMLNGASTAATVSVAFAGYLNSFLTVPIIFTAFLTLLFSTLINISGIRQSTWASIIFTSIEISGLLLIISLGFIKGDIGKSFLLWPSLSNITSVLHASSIIFFIYIGFEDLVNLSEETVRPAVTIPRALILSGLVTSIIYVAVAVAVTGLTDPMRASLSSAPLTTIVTTIHPWFGTAIGFAALCATASTVLIALISISRMIFGMARDGYFPKILAKIHSTRKTPYTASLTLFLLACIFLSFKEIETISSISSFGVLLVYILIHLSVIVLRVTQPNLWRPFRVPLSVHGIPVLPVIGMLASILLIMQFDFKIYLIGFGAISVGIVFYFIQIRFLKQR
jgi:basic amino acid/polyamine antiporter, APA family